MKRADTTSATIAVAMMACVASAGTVPTTAWVTETFDDGNASGWYWNYFDTAEMLITPSDGNPGAYLQTPETLVAPRPHLATTPGVPSAFTGNYVEQLAERLGVDLLVVQDAYGRAPVQQLSLRLVASGGWGVELFTDPESARLPEAGAGWKSFEFDVPSQGPMPADAVVFGDAPPEPWTTLMQDVDHVEFAFGERAWFEICWDFGLDNARILKVSNEPCTGDLDGSGDVGFPDLTTLLAAWGPCAACPEDLDGSGEVGFPDLTTLLANWGTCGG